MVLCLRRSQISGAREMEVAHSLGVGVEGGGMCGNVEETST